MLKNRITLQIPDWVAGFLDQRPEIHPSTEERMRLAIALAGQNIREQTGGPFGAAVFGPAGDLVSVGVNLVLSSGLSVWHAEMVALSLAQEAQGTHDLSSIGAFELVSSCEPCAMCLGAIPWTGIRSLVCGARDADARAVGFDEGAKPAGWPAALQARGIRVLTGILASESRLVLEDYARSGGVIY